MTPFIKLLTLSLTLLLISSFSSLKAQCAGFSATISQNSSGSSGARFHFNSTITGGLPPFSYQWDFGDGNSGTHQQESHRYSNINTNYPISCIITDANNCTYIAYDTVTVSVPIPCIGFSAPIAYNRNGNTIDYTTTVINGTAPFTYSWAYWDNSSNYIGYSPLINPSKIYSNSPTDYRTTLMIYDANGCISRDSIAIPLPSYCLGFAATASSSVSGNNVNFSSNTIGGTAPFLYHWNFGDGNTSPLNNPSHTYIGSMGSYPVTLTVTDSNNCSYTIYDTVNVSISHPCMGFVTTIATSINDNDVAFSNTVTAGNAPFVYQWNFGDGNTSNLSNPNHTYNNLTASYHISLTITDVNSCTYTAHDTVHITPCAGFYATISRGLNGPQFLFNSTITGGLAPFSYQWDFGDGNSSTNKYQSHVYSNFNASYPVSFAVTDANNCTYIVYDTVTVSLPSSCIGFAASASYNINGNTVNYTSATTGGTAPFTYRWEFWNSANTYLNASSLINPSNTYSSFPTDYRTTLIVHDANGCRSRDSIVILPPVINSNSSIFQNNIELQIHPNPVVDVLNLKIHTLERLDGKISIFDISGKELLTTEINLSVGDHSLKFPVDQLPAGVFLLKLTAHSTQETFKFVKEK